MHPLLCSNVSRLHACVMSDLTIGILLVELMHTFLSVRRFIKFIKYCLYLCCTITLRVIINALRTPIIIEYSIPILFMNVIYIRNHKRRDESADVKLSSTPRKIDSQRDIILHSN